MKKLAVILLSAFVFTLVAQTTPNQQPKDPKAKTTTNCCDDTNKKDCCKDKDCKDKDCCKDKEVKKEEIKKEDANKKEVKKENKK